MQKVQYKDATDTGTGPSPAIWGNCPKLDYILDPSKGTYFFDDFTNTGPFTTNTVAGAVGGTVGNWGYFLSNTATITNAALQGGVLTFTPTSSDLTAALYSTASPYKFNTGLGKFWWEARVKISSIATATGGVFIGLMESTLPTINIPLTTGDALADKNLVGFWHEASAGAASISTTYKADGVTAVTVAAAAATAVADTFVKLGMYFDGSVFYFYKDGAQLAASVANSVITSTAGTAFPNDICLGNMIGVNGMTTPLTAAIDWIGSAQERVS